MANSNLMQNVMETWYLLHVILKINFTIEYIRFYSQSYHDLLFEHVTSV